MTEDLVSVRYMVDHSQGSISHPRGAAAARRRCALAQQDRHRTGGQPILIDDPSGNPIELF
jgi:hypothetical protein